jgi:hypothetical protein
VAGWGEDGALDSVLEFAETIDTLARRLEDALADPAEAEHDGGVTGVFQRLDRTRVDDHHGLGLSIGIAHGATLTANARTQGGLSIEIHFPLMPSAMPRWAASVTLGRPASGRRMRR